MKLQITHLLMNTVSTCGWARREPGQIKLWGHRVYGVIGRSLALNEIRLDLANQYGVIGRPVEDNHIYLKCVTAYAVLEA